MGGLRFPRLAEDGNRGVVPSCLLHSSSEAVLFSASHAHEKSQKRLFISHRMPCSPGPHRNPPDSDARNGLTGMARAAAFHVFGPPLMSIQSHKGEELLQPPALTSQLLLCLFFFHHVVSHDDP